MTKWLLGDPHFSHKNILKFEPVRQFKDTEEMDETIINNYNMTVNDGDIVYWLGDMFFCNTPRMEYICNRLNLNRTRNILIRGNHDKDISNNKFRRLGFLPYKMYMTDGLILTHEPMTPTNLGMLRIYDETIIGNIHAHTHSKDIKLNPFMYQCVSMELINFKPVSLEDMKERMVNHHSDLWDWYDETKGNMPYFETRDHLR